MIFIGPSFPGGIAHHMHNYTRVFRGATYYSLADEIPECDHAYVFALPVDVFFDRYEYLKSKIKNISCFTVCETETVHEDFGRLMKLFKRVGVPSEFCRRVFSRQFPENEFYVIHPYVPPPKPYIFYTIGNITDTRKNFYGLLRAFSRIHDPDVRLVVKTQSNCPVNIQVPNVEFINEELDDHQMELLHRQCDCYVSFSHSEGVGMGALEAAVRDKPVIITNYGGAPEYIKTPYTIECTPTTVGTDYYLFKKDMIWGQPSEDALVEYMKDAISKKLRYMNHDHTKRLVSPESVIKTIKRNDA